MALNDAQRHDLRLMRAARRSARLDAPRLRASRIPAKRGAGSYRRKGKHGAWD